MDITRSARFPFETYDKAVNDSIEAFVSDIIDKGPEYIQENRDLIYTLLTTAAPAIANGTAITTDIGSFIPTTFSRPADYYGFSGLRLIADSVSYPVYPIDYNQLFVYMGNMYLAPTNKRPYYLENASGYTVYRGNTGTVTVSLAYIKTPAVFTLGNENSEVITEGAGVLTAAATYIALETGTVHNNVNYISGESFVAANTDLTAGAVILQSNTTPMDLPEKAQEKICMMAAERMAGAISDFNKAGFVEKEAGKS